MLNLALADEDLFARYGALEEDRFDEAFLPDGSVRPTWTGFFDWLVAAPEDFRAAEAELHRLRGESGIAFSSRAPDGAMHHDAIPIIIGQSEWAEIESAVLQRARLAEAALGDLYGPRRMINGGIVPPGLVFGSHSFAAHCANWERPPRRWTYVYEADIGRAADGTWRVLSDRLDAPLGDGWLLANRIASSQALATPFLDLGVRRVASHYAAFQRLLDRLMGWEGRLALLTGGEKDPRFFSHAYFARYLDAALVEPADLTVRDGAAYVKTLNGLKRIDVLLRGVPDLRLDALHRPGRAAFGAPALSLAARSGSLVVANALGSAAFAYRALAPYAHRLCQHLLGEDLEMQDGPCLWLGTAKAREQVLDDPDRWNITSLTASGALPGHPTTTGVGKSGETEKGAKEEPLEGWLARFGERLIATQTPPLARTPVWQRGAVHRSEWMMRVFACYTEDGWSIAPGGVASLVEAGHPVPALGFGKDVWVLDSDRERPDAGSAATVTADRNARSHLRRTGRDLLSRVADELFWLGRNAERAEMTLRLLALSLNRYLAGNRTDAAAEVLVDLIEIHAEKAEHLSPSERFRDGIARLLADPAEPWGLPTTLRALRSNMLRARSSLSEESWRFIDRLCSDPRWDGSTDLRHSAALSRLVDDSVQALAAFAGSAQENLTRNYAWRFLEIGRRIERGIQIARIAAAAAGTRRETEETYLRAWLSASDSRSAYRSRYMMTPHASAVVDLLILDETNPRALAFQIARLEEVLGELPADTPYRRPEHRAALALLTELRLLDADQLAEADDDGRRTRLIGLTERCRDDLARISDIVAQAFFAHSEIPEALVSHGRQTDREASDR